jgi:hypothetical protein
MLKKKVSQAKIIRNSFSIFTNYQIFKILKNFILRILEK